MKENLLDELTADPQDWEEAENLSHKMINDMFTYLKNIDDEPAWRPMSDEVKNSFKTNVPLEGGDLNEIYNEFKKNIFPYPKGNTSPRFWGWVTGSGTLSSIYADLWSAIMNTNAGAGEHSAIHVEQQVLNWMKEILGYPKDASGILAGGTSVGNLIALTVARNSFMDSNIKLKGLSEVNNPLVFYCSTETHNSVQKAVEIIGIGSFYLRKIDVDDNYQIKMDKLKEAINEDRKNNLNPVCVIGNVGTVNTGAVDPVNELVELCKKEKLWLHIDGAFGIFAKLIDSFKDELKAVEQADSVAFDLHKWMYLTYEVSCILIKNEELHKDTFSTPAVYLSKFEEGASAVTVAYGDYGVQLSRSFRALKIWFFLKEQGLKKYAMLVQKNLNQAKYLEDKIKQYDKLELLAPVKMNVVVFRYLKDNLSVEELNELNKKIIMTLQVKGIALPTHTLLKGRLGIRLAIVNHRSRFKDFDFLVENVLRIGDELTSN